jgi:hypothetical protein
VTPPLPSNSSSSEDGSRFKLSSHSRHFTYIEGEVEAPHNCMETDRVQGARKRRSPSRIELR